MLEDSGAIAVLTQGSAGLLWKEPGRPACVGLDLDRPDTWSRQPRTNPVHGCGPTNLAYVIYTSVRAAGQKALLSNSKVC